jgi:prepilin-type N-terminal cleavage/methylation domain-containing protein
MSRLASGFSLAELIIVLAVVGLGLTAGVPPLLKITAALRVRLAAEELVAVLRTSRSLAIQVDANVAVRFTTGAGGDVSFAIYRDGDGDGVLNEDIRSGADPEIAPPRRLAHVGREVRLGLPARPVRDPGDPTHWLDPTDPVRFNNSDLASFSPLGGATPGSLYVTDGGGGLAVVRVYGRTGKVRVLTYDFPTQRWRQ